MKRFIYLIIFLLIVVVIGVTLIPTDRNLIKKVVGGCRTAILNRDISGFMEFVSFNYSDDSGNSYLLLKKRLEKVLDGFTDFEISTDVMAMEIDKNRAKVHLKVSVIASEGDVRRYVIGDAGWPQDIRAYFEKTPSLQWKILRVEQFD
jgi:hypothetical protein